MFDPDRFLDMTHNRGGWRRRGDRISGSPLPFQSSTRRRGGRMTWFSGVF